MMWARGKARADRWTEEVVILLEEMRRTLAYCDWKAGWWRERRDSRFGSEELHDGTSAYASKQADMWNSLRQSFSGLWAPIIREYSLPADWPSSMFDFSLDNRSSLSAIDRNLMGRVKTALQLYNPYVTGSADLATLDTDWSLSESD